MFAGVGKPQKNLDDVFGQRLYYDMSGSHSRVLQGVGLGERAMDAPWEKAEVRCPNCLEILVLRPGLEEIWCQRCEEGYDVMESPNPRDPERTVLVLSKKREAPGRT